MINFFPVLYEDELLYSAISRYKQMCGMVSKRALETDLFDQRNGQKSVLFPTHLSTLVSNLPIGSEITVEELIKKHTLFPFYTAFLTQERADAAYRAMQENNKCSIENMVGMTGSKVKSLDYLRYCPLCFQIDINKNGISYWRRLHQVPGVLYCPKHQVLLKNSDVISNDSRADYLCADEEACNEEIKPDPYSQNVKNLNLQYIENVSYLLSKDSRRCGPSFIIQFYIDRLREKGLASTNGILFMADVIKEFLAFYPSHYLDLMQSSVDLDTESNWLRLFIRRTNKNRSPVRHLLVLQFLDVSVREFFETNEVIGRKSVSINRKPIFDVEKRRKEWLQLIEDNPGANRSELKQIGKGLHTWIYINDRDWYDQVTPKNQRKKTRTSHIDWEKRDEECLSLAKKGYETLINYEGKPIRIVPNNIRRIVGIKKWFFHEKLLKTNQFLNEIYEDIESYRVRKIKWAIEDRVRKGEDLTVYKVQLQAGFSGGNRAIKTLVYEILNKTVLDVIAKS